MTTLSSRIGSAFRLTAALSVLAFVPSAAIYGAVGDDNAGGVIIYTSDNCAVCGKDMGGSKDIKTTKIEGRDIRSCSEKCADDVKAKPEYYKGVYDGTGRERKRMEKKMKDK